MRVGYIFRENRPIIYSDISKVAPCVITQANTSLLLLLTSWIPIIDTHINLGTAGHRPNIKKSSYHLVGWLVIEVEHLYSALKQSINAVPARALSRTNHINAAHLSNSSSWAFQKLCIHICIYIMLLSSYLCVRVMQCVRGPMCASLTSIGIPVIKKVRPSYLYNGNFYAVKTILLYWDGPLIAYAHYQDMVTLSALLTICKGCASVNITHRLDVIMTLLPRFVSILLLVARGQLWHHVRPT